MIDAELNLKKVLRQTPQDDREACRHPFSPDHPEAAAEGPSPALTARAWLEISLPAILRNAASAAALSAPARIIPVLKGDAYGTGAVAVASALYGAGHQLFGVATVPEALEIKRALPDCEVLVMGPTLGAHIGEAIASGIQFALYAVAQARAASASALAQGLPARVHVKLNTGLNRIGFDDIRAAMASATLPGIRVEGLFTHLALRDGPSDRAQLNKLRAGQAAFSEAGIAVPMVHALDSIGMVRYPGDRMDAVRPGAWLYGTKPKGYAGPAICEPVATFKARIAQIRELPPGALIGYDEDHPLAHRARIATVTAGYADGYPRLCGKGFVEVCGSRAPLAGLVSMDQMTCDVTLIPEAREGDEVTLLGGGISIDEYAGWLDLNRNDALSRVSNRVPRVYF